MSGTQDRHEEIARLLAETRAAISKIERNTTRVGYAFALIVVAMLLLWIRS